MPDPVRDLHEQVVARLVSPAVVDRLEPVQVHVEDRKVRALAALSEPFRDRLHEMHSVRQAGQRVVVGLVAQLLLQLRHLGQRMLEASVLDQDAGMSGEGLEQVAIGLSERAHVAGALADDQETEGAVLTVQRTDDGVAEAA